MQVLTMDSASVFDASHYAQFPNYPQIELDYMRFLSKEKGGQVSEIYTPINLIVGKCFCCQRDTENCC